MRKINALIKYEVTNLKRGKLIWIMSILYAFGVQQCISSMYKNEGLLLSLVGLIKVSWLPLNFIMIPLMLISMEIGKSDNEIFKAMDISHKERMLSKVITVFIVDGVILAINITLAIIIGLLSKVSMEYFLYQIIGYTVNTMIFLLVCSSIGLLIGQVFCRYVGEEIGFIIVIICFVILSNFYKTSNTIIPLINIRTFPSNFDIISYDKRYLYHNIFWLIMCFAFFIICFLSLSKKEEIKKNLLVKLGPLILMISVAMYLSVGIYSMSPSFYDIASREDSIKGQYDYDREEIRTFFGKKDCGYYIDKYDMDININNKLNNNCSMEIKVDGVKINSIELGLYKKLNISKLEVDGQEVNFERTNHSFIVNLPRGYGRGEKIKMNVNYEGIINTQWVQGKQLFFVRNNGIFLADVFEWYPKLNHSNIKEYSLDIKYSGKNKIYSNLNEENKLGECKIKGKDKEIFLVSGNIKERKYKDYLFIGNEEGINSDKKCDRLINEVLNKNLSEVKKIVIAPYIPGIKKMDENYEKAYLGSEDR
ncbi:hypothetical protein [Clostridium amazonitimonense]|uniref:hypothetical protein n=1 Tax=Clostridium amazonitimonense TaxID=1499689 RepID=UPI000509CC3E|nr:hypothetical protein [Clostridium amazonitimonense]